VRHEYLIQWNW